MPSNHLMIWTVISVLLGILVYHLKAVPQIIFHSSEFGCLSWGGCLICHYRQYRSISVSSSVKRKSLHLLLFMARYPDAQRLPGPKKYLCALLQSLHTLFYNFPLSPSLLNSRSNKLCFMNATLEMQGI